MKKSLISLMEGSPTKFFDDIRAKLAEKVNTVCESVATEVAPEVFVEAKTFGKDKNVADEDNAKITKGQTAGKAPEKIKKTVAEEVEPLEELSKATLGSYVKGASDSQHANGAMGEYNRSASKIYAKNGNGTAADLARKSASDNDRKIINRRKGIRTAVNKLTKEEVQPVAEDLGAHTISTSRGGKAGKTFSTLVVNKKRRTAADKDRSWKSMIMKATPKETEWDKHTKGH